MLARLKCTLLPDRRKSCRKLVFEICRCGPPMASDFLLIESDRAMLVLFERQDVQAVLQPEYQADYNEGLK